MASYNYYEILEVSPSSAQHEISQAYEKARATYSGENPAIYTMFSGDEAKELLRLVEEAYSVLGNKTLRAIYDEKITQGLSEQTKGLSFQELQTESLAPKRELPKVSKNSRPTFTAKPEMEDFIRSHQDWTGSDLRKCREYKNYSLQDLSEVTKISAFYLNALEEMKPENLPAPVFVRGYVLVLAKLLGLNEKIVADSFMKNLKRL